MLQLSPGEQFPIVRQLNDPSDTATYFVQAVIKRSVDEVTLAIVNLDDQGSQRFKKNWQVGSDNGLGVFITITSTVYTDSAYTVKSDIYGIQSIEYLIQERPNRSFGGGTGVNYDTIRKIVRQEFEKMETLALPGVKVPKFDYSMILTELAAISQLIKSIVIPEHKAPDFSKLERLLGDIQRAVKSIPLPEKVDLNAISDKLKTTIKNIPREMANENLSELAKMQEKSKEDIRVLVTEALDKITAATEKISKTQFELQDLQFVVKAKSPEVEGKKNGELPKFRLPRKIYKQND